MHYGHCVWRVSTKQGFKKDYKMLTWAEKFAKNLVKADITLIHVKANGHETSGRRIWMDGVSLLTDWERMKIS